MIQQVIMLLAPAADPQFAPMATRSADPKPLSLPRLSTFALKFAPGFAFAPRFAFAHKFAFAFRVVADAVGFLLCLAGGWLLLRLAEVWLS